MVFHPSDHGPNSSFPDGHYATLNLRIFFKVKLNGIAAPVNSAHTDKNFVTGSYSFEKFPQILLCRFSPALLFPFNMGINNRHNTRKVYNSREILFTA